MKPRTIVVQLWTGAMPVAVTCAGGCGRREPVAVTDTTIVPAPDDPSLPVVHAPPRGWIAHQDTDDSYICGSCATPAEMVAWMSTGQQIDDGWQRERDAAQEGTTDDAANLIARRER